MFYYYGRKKKVAGEYPPPHCDTIIEPFAGSAAYSLHGDNWKREVILIERDPQIAALWRWLISEATREDILNFPDPIEGEVTEHLLHILHGASKRWFTYKRTTATPMLIEAWRASKPYMVEMVSRVKHWTLIEGDYTLAPDVEATWFIDPPYQGEPGTGYRHGSEGLDYGSLGAWCRARQGEVIVCDGPGANWLPFKPWVTLVGAAGKKSTEHLYYRSDVVEPQVSVLDLFGTE